LHRLSEGALLVCNLVIPRDAKRGEEAIEEIRRLSPPRAASGALPEALLRTDSPGWSDWEAGIEHALSEFSVGNLGKVVLARRAGLEFGEVLDPLQLAADLKAGTPGCFRFYVQPEAGMAFLGASPERLFRRDGRSILSEAVAGTRPRGASEADDADLREELMSSKKDLSEHAYVVSAIRDSLGGLCEDLDIEEHVSEMKLARGRHLVSKIRGTLREGVSDAELLKGLHPTPAVGGHPKDRALRTIRELEPFDRGWYAGPVGWIGSDAAEFAVGIRSGLARGRTLALFSGAGIVSGSVPEEEWAEIEQKIGDFTGILGLERSSEYAAR
jgi:menaquinone-specific isochorismate synthase